MGKMLGMKMGISEHRKPALYNVAKNYGDVTKIDGHTVEPVDCVIGGSPCQNLSVAGNRKGLEGNESRLFLEQMRVIKEIERMFYTAASKHHAREKGDPR